MSLEEKGFRSKGGAVHRRLPFAIMMGGSDHMALPGGGGN